MNSISKIYVLLILLHINIQFVNSQSNLGETFVNNMRVPHQEQVYVHTNSTFAFVGEYIYYSIYCLKDNTGLLSDVSKIAYLKLVNENQEIVLNQKIKLTNGIGDSNFFIPSSIPSGNYKLIGYTQWMLNNGSGYFYSTDLTVLNPYTSDQAVFRTFKKVDTLSSFNKIIQDERVFNEKSPIRLNLSKETFLTREPITVAISSSSSEGLGNYSISVKKVDELENIVASSSVNFREVYPQKQSIEKRILPELRGELLEGKLTFDNDFDSIQNKAIGVSFPGEEYLFKIATTDEKGQFFVNIEEDYATQNVYVQVLDESEEDYKIELKSEEKIDLSELKFNKFELSRNMDSVIKKRSIYNQIENAYYSSKPDTILIGKPNSRFYGNATMEYILDEYTRFATITETFIEVVEHVWIQKNKEGKNEFHVRPIVPYVESGKLPMVFVDGLLLLDHERLINLSSSQVESINISRNQHFYGTRTFQGVVDVTTFKSDFYEHYYSDKMLSKNLFKPNEKKNYYQQSYKDNLKNEFERLPDFRYQLIWVPKFQMKTKNDIIEFFSSDITGKFEISLEGFTNAGVPVSLKKNFWVN